MIAVVDGCSPPPTLRDHPPKSVHRHDLGQIALAFERCSWAYFDFSQLLIIWSGKPAGKKSVFLSNAAVGGWAFRRCRAGFHSSFHFSCFSLRCETYRKCFRRSPLAHRHALWTFLDDAPGVHFFAPCPSCWTWVCPSPRRIWLGLSRHLKHCPLSSLGDPKLAEPSSNHEH